MLRFIQMDGKEKLTALEREKERMIGQYMQLQDKADSLNDEIYHVCCDIEALNVQISMAQETLRKAALKPAPANGKGKTHLA